MKLCRVIGKANSSIKHAGLQAFKMLVVQVIEKDGKGSGSMLLAIDTVGAGADEVVAVVQGGSAVKNVGKGDIPCDAAVVAIMDNIFVENKEIYNKYKEV